MKTNRKEKIIEKVKKQTSVTVSHEKKIAPHIWSDVIKALKEKTFLNEKEMIEGVIAMVFERMKLKNDPDMKEALTLMLESDDAVRKILNRELKVKG